jgi:hypothetical protein
MPVIGSRKTIGTDCGKFGGENKNAVHAVHLRLLPLLRKDVDMNYFSYRKALFKLHQERQRVSEAISKLVEEARKTGGEAKAREVYQIEGLDFEMIDDEILDLVSRYLVNKANKRVLPVPPLSEKDGLWERSNFTGRHHLTDKGITEIRKMIRRDTKESLDIFSPYIGILFGLIGAVTGLIAVIKR